MGYIIVIARLPGIYGDVNRPCPRATPSDSGRFTAINPGPRAITITYCIVADETSYVVYEGKCTCVNRMLTVKYYNWLHNYIDDD